MERKPNSLQTLNNKIVRHIESNDEHVFHFTVSPVLMTGETD